MGVHCTHTNRYHPLKGTARHHPKSQLGAAWHRMTVMVVVNYVLGESLRNWDDSEVLERRGRNRTAPYPLVGESCRYCTSGAGT